MHIRLSWSMRRIRFVQYALTPVRFIKFWLYLFFDNGTD